MRIVFTESAWESYLWWQEHDRKLVKRINLLIKDALRSPFEGIGKPEPLKAELSGYWSRRINDEHRLVYTATSSELIIISCRFRYSKSRVLNWQFGVMQIMNDVPIETSTTRTTST